MMTLINDFKYGLRMLGKNPSFSLIVAMLVAIGVGANTAMFSIFSAFLIRPLPYEKSDRLALVYQCSDKQKSHLVSHLNYLDWRQQANSFEALACYKIEASFWKITENELANEYMKSYVSGNFFQVFGVNPSLGRFYSEEDEQPSAACVAVIIDAFWRQHFGADKQVIGKTIYHQEKIPYTIVGVAPPDFRYPAYAEQKTAIWYPIALHEGENWLRVRNNCVFEVLGKLKAGVEVHQAQAEMQMINARLAAEYPEANTDMSARIVLLQDHMAGGKRQALTLMMGAVGFVFLVACVNLAGLLFARGITRERELAVRSALGASRFRLVRQLLVENLILACLGCGLGVFTADGAFRLLMHTDMVASMLLPEGFFRINMRVLGFALAISVIGIPLVSLLPSICCAFLDLARVLAAEGRSVLGPSRRNTIHIGLVSVEVALTIVLLVAAGLMIHSCVNVVTTDPGFNPENIMTMNLWLDHGGHKELLQQLQGLQGVDKAALAYPVLGGWSYFVCAEGQPAPSSGQATLVSHRRVTSDYFGIMGIRLLQGRFFDERDHSDSSPMAIVDDTLAKLYWHWLWRA